MLTEKENYLMTLRGETPEWVPIYTFGPPPPGGRPPANAMVEAPITNGHRERGGGPDIWGVNYIPTESTGNAIIPDNSTFILPLEKLSHWRDIIKAPEVSGTDWEKMVSEHMGRINIDRTQTALGMGLHVGYFQLLMSFMGFEDGLIAFYEEPETVHELLEYLSTFYISIADRVIDLYQPDVITLIDDTAAWGAPFISPETYREFIMPHHDKWAKRGRDRGLPITMHNCGKCESVVDLFVQMGVRSWDPAQTCNDLKGIKAKYGNDLVIAGGWDGRGRLLEADVTEEELRQSVRDTMDAYAPGGGYVWAGGFLSAVGDEAAKRKNEILQDEARKYGRDFYQ